MRPPSVGPASCSYTTAAYPVHQFFGPVREGGVRQMPRDNVSTMPLGEHLEELRTRLIHGLLGLVPIVVIALIFGGELLGFLIKPAQKAVGGSLIALGPLETFGTYMKVSFIAALIIGSPWLLYQLW